MTKMDRMGKAIWHMNCHTTFHQELASKALLLEMFYNIGKMNLAIDQVTASNHKSKALD